MNDLINLKESEDKIRSYYGKSKLNLKEACENRFEMGKELIKVQAFFKKGKEFNNWIKNNDLSISRRTVYYTIGWTNAVLSNPDLKYESIRKLEQLKPKVCNVAQTDTTNKEQKQDKKVTPSDENTKMVNGEHEKNNGDEKITLSDYREMETKARVNAERAERLSKLNVEKDSKIRELIEQLKGTEGMVSEIDYMNVESDKVKFEKFLKGLLDYIETVDKIDVVKVKLMIKNVLAS